MGDDVVIKDEVSLTSCSVLPHKSVSASLYEPQIVMVSAGNFGLQWYSFATADALKLRLQ